MRQGEPKVRLSGRHAERAALQARTRSHRASPGKRRARACRSSSCRRTASSTCFAESADRVAKERAMRRRQLKWLWGRLPEELAEMRLARNELLMKLGAARGPALRPAGGSSTLKWQPRKPASASGSTGRGCGKPAAAKAAIFCAAILSRADPAKLWDYYLQLVADRRGLQDHQGRSRHPADLPSARGADRGAYLHCLPGLLPARHPRPPPEEPRAGLRMFMKVHSVFTKVHSRGAVLRARRLRLPHTPPRGAVCAAGV